MRLTTKRNGKNVIPMLMAVCGLNLPYWRIDRADGLHSYLSGDAADKLADYEEAEEQGLLVRLPCKVGDTIYVIFDGKIWDGEVYHISYSDYYGKITATAWVKQGISAAFEHFGETVFLTREEAEAAMNGGTGDDCT